MKDTYSVTELKHRTAEAVRVAELGHLVTITRRDASVVHVISAARLGAMLEAMELLADPKFMTQLKKLRAGKLKFLRASSLAD